MVEVLAANKQALETELRERIQKFFEANNEVPESVSIQMNLAESEEENSISKINILVKDK